jgi:ABC-type transport system involved in multi-copper enzyme maturation permease subunit
VSARSLEARLAAFGDRLNPILVKEVRAALRGRFFRSVFAILLSLALVVSLGFMILTNPEELAGRGSVYFMILSACMSLGLHGLVPFSAMLSMTAESDEHTLELLQLSGLAASRIVLGKLVSALVQALLVYSAFLPFLMFTFLQQGVGIGTLLQSVAGSLLTCAALSSLGILLGSLARARWARVLLLLLFALILLQSAQLGLVLILASSVGGVTSPASGTISVVGGITGLAATGFFVVLASARLAHAEENQSTPARVGVSLMILAALVALAVTGDPTIGEGCLFWALGLGAIPMFLAATERETLPRAVPATLPRSRVRRVLVSPWLPGGARGALFVVLHLAVALLGFEALQPRMTFGGHGFERITTYATILIAFVLGPAALLARFTRTPGSRLLVRLSILGLFALSNVALALLAFFLPAAGISGLSPVGLLFSIGDEPRAGAMGLGETGLGLLAVLAFFINLPRVIASFRELRAIPVRGASPGANGGPLDAAPQP